ncbi:uncharacterized protein ARMOST_08590 [Armillaria ostoyae]|uniref:HTH CENPB-type domain-containing protein n=1 Tax=Armillaria ostoyae TaxID=47428 RepID=A0A284R918_ARMOS|nr:uncharacterized protein ARMOST_08590 [Armillaria ostoyae]
MTFPKQNVTTPTIAELKKTLKLLKDETDRRRKDIKTRLAQKKSVSREDEEWLDEARNLVDEVVLVESLAAAPDLDAALKILNEHQRDLYALLIGKIRSSVSKKRKRPEAKQTAADDGKSKGKTDKPPVFTKKEVATLDQRVEILDWHHQNGKNQSKTAKHFAAIYPNLKIKQPLVSAWIKNKAKWREEHGKSGENAQNIKRLRQTQHPEITEMMELWVAKAMSDGLLLTGEVLCQKWRSFASLAGVPDDEKLGLSEGWLTSFKNQTGLKRFKRHSEAASANMEDVEAECERIRLICTEYAPEDIYNMDETGLFYGMPPDCGLADKKHSRVKGSKVCLTYTFTANADGSDKLEPFIIGKAKCPHAFNKKSGENLGFYYRNNAKAWMTTVLYQEWILKWDAQLRLRRRKILLFQDNFSGHIIPCSLQCIRVENFKPNMTSHVQPNDAGIIHCFKAHYRSRYIQHAIDRYDQNIPTVEIYDINQLEAMRLAMTDVEESLDALQTTGVLQTANWMSIESLLNPEAELDNMEGEVTDEDIFKAVMTARNEEEVEEMGDADADVCIDPLPSRKEALKAVSTLQKYIGSLDVPYLHQLEGILASFGRQTRLEEAHSLKDTEITMYFTFN